MNLIILVIVKDFCPTTIEGKIVSDADMCDALGANGILRVYTYSIKNGKPFFNKNTFPMEDMSAEDYVKKAQIVVYATFLKKY